MRRLTTALLLLLALAGAARAQTPCGSVPGVDGEPPTSWYTEDGDGHPRPCDAGPPSPAPTPPPDIPFEVRAWLGQVWR